MRSDLPKRAALAATLLFALFSFAPPAQKKKPSAIDRALAAAFPDCTFERVACKLDDDQIEEVRDLASQPRYAKERVFAYVAKDEDGNVVGTAFFDAHVVRTKRETLLVAVRPDGRVRGVDTIAFQEPPEYIAQDAFYASLVGRAQGRALQLGRGLDGTTGATLTCRAVADATRRALALHEVLGERVGRETPKPAPKERKGGTPGAVG